jgi:hypothetical protein
VYSEVVRAYLRGLARLAAKVGKAGEIATTLRGIDFRLRTDPVGFGDPGYHLHQLGLLKSRAFRPPFYLYYAVDEVRRIVYVTEFRVTPGSSLGTSPDSPDNG